MINYFHRGEDMRVFDTRHLNQNQRFAVAVAASVLSSIILGIFLGMIRKMFNYGNSTLFGYTLIHLVGGYAIGYLIQKVGRGVQQRFSVAAAIATVVMIFISIAISMGFPLTVLFELDFYALVMRAGFADAGGLLTLIYQAIAVFLAYSNARVV